MALRASDSDPLALDDQCNCPAPLLSFEAALERSVFGSGLSSSEWLKRLANELHKPQLAAPAVAPASSQIPFRQLISLGRKGSVAS